MDLKHDCNTEAATGEAPAAANPSVGDAPVDFRDSDIHGRGGFASVRIPQGARVIEYIGERISKTESVQRCQSNNEFIFTLTETKDLDGNVPWNPARFINHSCEPNCEAVLDVDRIWIIALRDIQPGEELTFNYGYDLADYREHPCRCGASSCVGYIVSDQFFGHVRKQQEYACDADWPPAA